MRGLLLAFLMFQGIEIHAANEADLVIKNAQIFTASQNIGEAEAVAVKDGRFLAVGTNDEIQRYVGPDSTIIDVAGKSVLPGFIDSHIHISSGTAYVQGLDLFGITKKSDWLEMIRLSAKNVPK